MPIICPGVRAGQQLVGTPASNPPFRMPVKIWSKFTTGLTVMGSVNARAGSLLVSSLRVVAGGGGIRALLHRNPSIATADQSVF